MDVEMCEETTTTPGFSIPQNAAINLAPSCVGQTALVSFVKDIMDAAVSCEDHIASIPVNYPEDFSKATTLSVHDPKNYSEIANPPIVKTNEGSVGTEVSICEDSLPVNNSAHASMLAFAPAEIRHLIFKFAMTAEKGEFFFNDQTEPFTPNVATGLMRVNHAFYHEARPYLYSQNAFVFTRCGSDLRIILQRRDASRYGEALSPLRTTMPLFNKVVFEIGDDYSLEIGRFKTQCFAAALGGLRDQVIIRNLDLFLGLNCWAAESGPFEFVKALKNIKVTKRLEMVGREKLLLHDIRTIPRALKMNIQPEYSSLYPCDLGIDTRSFFRSTYVPAKKPEEISLQPGQILVDAGIEFYARLMGSNHMER